MNHLIYWAIFDCVEDVWLQYLIGKFCMVALDIKTEDPARPACFCFFMEALFTAKVLFGLMLILRMLGMPELLAVETAAHLIAMPGSVMVNFWPFALPTTTPMPEYGEFSEKSSSNDSSMARYGEFGAKCSSNNSVASMRPLIVSVLTN